MYHYAYIVSKTWKIILMIIKVFMLKINLHSKNLISYEL